MSKKKPLDELTKAKLIYSVELGIFAVLFLVLSLLFFLRVIPISDWKRWVFTIGTLAGGVWIFTDLIWTIVSKKRRAKNALIDKIMVAPLSACLITFDIICLVNAWETNSSGDEWYRIAIGTALAYGAAVYAFQAIYHWFFPVPMVLETSKEMEKAKLEEEAEAQKAQEEAPSPEEEKQDEEKE